MLYPTTLPLIEKMAALFPQDIEVVGPHPPSPSGLGALSGRLGEWQDLGLRIAIRNASYSDIDFAEYDLLIESAETAFFSDDWKNHCHRWECPTIIRACWSRDPSGLPPGYASKKDCPILIEHPPHVDIWKAAGWPDVTALPEPAGDWWFKREWTGAKEQILFVLAGKDLWRPADRTCLGLDVWDAICQRFPGKTLHHDGAVNYKTMQQMSEMFSESRVFVNLDTPYGAGERSMALVFTEALCAGLPVVARDIPGLSYHDYISGNGVCTNNFVEMCGFLEHCLSNREFAKGSSTRSREIGSTNFSTAALRGRYDEVIERARSAFANRVG